MEPRMEVNKSADWAEGEINISPDNIEVGQAFPGPVIFVFSSRSKYQVIQIVLKLTWKSIHLQ